VLVGFGNTVGEFKVTVIQAVREWEFSQLLVWKNFLDLSTERLIHAVIVVGIEEAARFEVLPQPSRFLVREVDVAVTRHEDKRVRKEVFARDLDELILGVNVDASILFYKREKIDLFIWIVVPVSTASVFESGDFKGTASGCLLRQGGVNEEAKNETSSKQFRYVPREFQCLFGVVFTKR